LAVVGWVWLSSPSIQLDVVRMEPSLMMDDKGTPWLVTLSLSNRSGVELTLEHNWLKVESRAANQWTEADKLCHLGTLRARGRQDLLVLLPSDSAGVRLHLKYEPPPFRRHLWQWLGPRGQTIVVKMPRLRNWFWPPVKLPLTPGPPPQHHWKRMTVETQLPRRAK
jgi:hypothetical protein